MSRLAKIRLLRVGKLRSLISTKFMLNNLWEKGAPPLAVMILERNELCTKVAS